MCTRLFDLARRSSEKNVAHAPRGSIAQAQQFFIIQTHAHCFFKKKLDYKKLQKNKEKIKKLKIKSKNKKKHDKNNLKNAKNKE